MLLSHQSRSGPGSIASRRSQDLAGTSNSGDGGGEIQAEAGGTTTQENVPAPAARTQPAGSERAAQGTLGWGGAGVPRKAPWD